MVKVITINILFKLEDWEHRRELLVQGLAAEQADLIALQEVNLVQNTGDWLAEQLGMPYVSTVPFPAADHAGMTYGIAILSRYPFVQQAAIDLQSQGRLAQVVTVLINHQPVVLCNGHYYWYPGSHPERDRQIQIVLDYLELQVGDQPVIAVGDFNGTPETSAIERMRQRFTSAYAAYHGQEPDYTCPPPIAPWDLREWLYRSLRTFLFNRTFIPWKGTLDYIFVSSAWQVHDCRLILTQPAQGSNLYPSDHFGIVADLSIVNLAVTN
ncbi:MAG: endonuclease/exonuclease/phosphatase [Alkalinema sp. CACIAM 70d]|nr:MAG: endonuclease/exonuclease/phosphatase [Alkalinema sp. CACIAM 70d]